MAYLLASFRVPLVRAVICLTGLAGALTVQAAQITVDAAAGRLTVSPALYGKNESLGSTSQPLSDADWLRFRDSELKILRLNGGNNSTKYNWRKKLSSHPDWYNNVYAYDWDYTQSTLQAKLPGVQGMWAFQLIGKTADNTNNNFNDWAYNRSQWWEGVAQNLAGGGTLNPTGSKALKEGNPALYLTDTDAEGTTSLLDHWIKPSGLGLDRRFFRYWNMDNEPEIWNGTHDDVMPTQISAEAFMQRYFATAKLARARFPEIKLAGPVPANEWQWYNWATPITVDGRRYPWLEYFIKRIGEEQKRTGIRLLDVLDIHYYPGSTRPEEIVQLHRVFFDRNYVSPDANGVYTVTGGWDTSINKEYIFGRCEEWLVQYLGPKHGVTFGVSEIGLQVTNAPLAAVWYASTLTEFMERGVELFTPWTWQPGMWEVLHLLARYNLGTVVSATSDDETYVSATCTVDDAKKQATLVLINRALTETKSASVSFNNLSVPNGFYSTRQLANLPSSETFVSAKQNALNSGQVAVTDNRCTISLPPLSITSIQLATGAVAPAVTPSRLGNLAVRAVSGKDAEKLIVGFAVRGTGVKPLLLRGIGPKLVDFQLSGVLPDPTLSLSHQTKGFIAANENWSSGGALVVDTAKRLGAFPLDEGSKDAALLASLTLGDYSFSVADSSGATGVALGEIYDGEVNGTAKLINVSARVRVGSDQDVLIAGFAVQGDLPKKLLIRAVGPGLTPFNVRNFLGDPMLSVFRQGEDEPLYVNDDWGQISYAHEIAAVAKGSGAFEIPLGSKDAVLLLELPPGLYSAVVRGVGVSAGVALVEVYEVTD